MPIPIEVSDDGFLNMLRCLNGGAVVEELDRELIKGISAILDHGGSSSITLKISVKRIKNMEAAVTIEHDVVAKHPKESRPAKAMFLTHGNGVVDQPQHQQPLGLGEASAPRQNKLTEESGSKIARLDTGARK